MSDDRTRVIAPETALAGAVAAAAVTRTIVLDEMARDAIDDHVGANSTIEQGGVLVGDIDEDTGQVTIVAAIPASKAVGAAASLTFTHDAWDEINEVMTERYPDHRIVGWYHSHPSFGIFLSDYDTFIHRNFFSTSWQLAYVVDPLHGKAGFFGWDDGTIVPITTWTVLARGAARTVKRVGPEVPADSVSADPPAKRRRLRVTVSLLIGVALAAGLLGGYLLSRAGTTTPAAIIERRTFTIRPSLTVSWTWRQTGHQVTQTVQITNAASARRPRGTVTDCAAPMSTVGATRPANAGTAAHPACPLPDGLGPGQTRFFTFQGAIPGPTATVYEPFAPSDESTSLSPSKETT